MTSSDISLARESRIKAGIAHVVLATMLTGAPWVHAADPPEQAIAPPAAPGPAAGLADSAGLRATVFGTPPQERAPMPERVPLDEMEIALPWARPVPDVFWF